MSLLSIPDIDEETYSCCCSFIGIKNGAYGVAVFYVTMIVSNLGIRLVKSCEVQWNWQLLFLVSDTIAVVCLVYGVVREQPAFLQPFTIISIITVSFCILLTAFYASAVIDPTSYAGEQVEILLAGHVPTISNYLRITTHTVITLAASLGALVYAVTVFIHSWFLVIVVRCAQYLRKQQTLTCLLSWPMIDAILVTLIKVESNPKRSSPRSPMNVDTEDVTCGMLTIYCSNPVPRAATSVIMYLWSGFKPSLEAPFDLICCIKLPRTDDYFC